MPRRSVVGAWSLALLCGCAAAEVPGSDPGVEWYPDHGADEGADGDADGDRDDAADVDARPAVCGDGVVGGSEECDDGNTEALDGCSGTCRFEYCGDGETGETLDVADDFETGDLARLPWAPGADGFAATSAQVHGGAWAMGSTNGGRTSTTSTVSLRAPSDGRACFWYAGESEDGYDEFRFSVDGAELLVAGGDHRTWTEYCAEMAAGMHEFEWRYGKDGSVDTGWDAYYVDDVRLSRAVSEECDDGGNESGDGCSAACRVEECGNAVRDVGEECDDGNTTALDGCSATCALEYCGDGVVGVVLPVADDFETGDLARLPWTPGRPDGFAVATDQVHGGAYALGPTNRGLESTTATISLAGPSDGRVCFWYAGESEECCDHFRFSVDGAELLVTEGDDRTWTEYCADVTPGAHAFAWSYGKDGSVDTGWDAYYVDDVVFVRGGDEQCDDGNTTPGDGCDANCRVE